MDIVVQAIAAPTMRTVPSAVIVEALRRLNERSHASPGQGVILPPRVTRRREGGNEVISVAALVRAPLPADMTEPQRVSEIVAAVRDALDDIEMPGTFSDGPMAWPTATGAVHNPVVNGSVEFWTSGEAGQTRTRESTTALSLDYADNPVGPNSDDLTEHTLPGEAGRLVREASSSAATDMLYALALVTLPIAAAWGASSLLNLYREWRRPRALPAAPRAGRGA